MTGMAYWRLPSAFLHDAEFPLPSWALVITLNVGDASMPPWASSSPLQAAMFVAGSPGPFRTCLPWGKVATQEQSPQEGIRCPVLLAASHRFHHS